MLRSLAAVLLVLVSLSCSGSSTRGVSAGHDRGIPTTCVVAVPFEISPMLEVEDETSDLLATYLVEALGAAGLRVIPPGDLTTLLASSQGEQGRARAQNLAFAADREFGCNVVAIGRVDRFRNRSGEAMGSQLAASVAFDLRLFGAPGGQALWQGRFDETQKALTENFLRARRYPGRGTRWLTANEFARWGVAEVVQAAPLVPRASP